MGAWMNAQNCRIEGDLRPNVVHEQRLHVDYMGVQGGFSTVFTPVSSLFEEVTHRCPVRRSYQCTLHQLLSFYVIPSLQEQRFGNGHVVTAKGSRTGGRVCAWPQVNTRGFGFRDFLKDSVYRGSGWTLPV